MERFKTVIKNRVKDIKTLNAHLKTVLSKIDILKKELDETKRHSLKLEKAKVIRALVEELEELHPKLIEAREKIVHFKRDYEEKKPQFSKRIKRFFAQRRDKIDKFKKIFEIHRNFIYSEFYNNNFLGHHMKKPYFHHLCVAGLAGTLFACGGGGGGATAGGGTPTQVATGSNSSTSSGGSAVGASSSSSGTSSSGGSVEAAKPTPAVGTFAHGLTLADPPLTDFKSNTVGYRLTARFDADGKRLGNNAFDADNTQNETLTFKITPPKAGDTNYKIAVTNGRGTTEFDINSDATTATNGTSTLKSLDGNLQGLLKGTDENLLKNGFKHLIRFREESQVAKDSSPFDGAASERDFLVRYGVIGTQTSTSGTITSLLQGAGLSSNVTYTGKLDGEPIGEPDQAFSRSATFTVDLTKSEISGKIAKIEGVTSGLESVSLETGSSTISGNGFSFTSLSVDDSSSCTSNCPTLFPIVTFTGSFYGQSAEELGGTFDYTGVSDDGGSRRLSRNKGAFAAKR